MNPTLTKIRYNGLMLRHVKNQTPELCALAVQQNGNALKFVKNQTPEICALAEIVVKQTKQISPYIFIDVSL